MFVGVDAGAESVTGRRKPMQVENEEVAHVFVH